MIFNAAPQGKYVQTFTRVLGTALLAVLIGEPVAALPALAQASMSATAATLSGTISDGAGSPIAGATITLSGPSSAKTISDSNGHYSVSVAPGLYKVVVHAPGFSDNSDDSVTINNGATADVRLVRPSLSSIQTIGTVRSSGNGGPAFNTTPASESIINAQAFQDQGDIGVRNLLDETPGIVVSVSNGSANGGVRGAITYPNIRGGLSYETASLLDGHAVSVGKYGDYVTSFLNSAVFQSIEVVKGPGALPPTINRSVNGTVNFRTWDPTTNLTGNLTYGYDDFGGDFSNVRISDSVLNKKLGFVIDFATEGTPGAGGNVNPRTFVAGISDVSYTNSAGVPVTVTPIMQVKAPGSASTYSSLATNTIACCVSMPTWYSNKSELAKLRYNFSDVTQFTATMLASQTYASQNGNNENLFNTAFNPSTASAYIPSGNVQAFEPYNDNFAQDYEFNNEPIFQAEFRTQFHNDTILARFYSASIGRMQTNGDQSNATFSQPVQLYGVTTTGQPLTGNDAFGNPYIATISDPLYQSMEQDNLTGYTFSYNHQLGNSGGVITASADENYSSTHVYTPGQPDTSSSSNIAAGSQQNTATFRLYGTFQLGPKITATAGYYLSRFDTHFADLNGATPAAFVFSDDVNWHGDERVAFTYEPARGTSLRLSAGSALVSPYLGILSGSTGTPAICTSSTCPVGYPTGTVYTQSVGGFNVKPETSFGYDLGMDHRFNQFPDTVFSGDLYFTNLQNQFLKSTYINGTYNGPQGTLPLAVTAYSNLSNARYEGIEAGLTHKPPAGWGWIAQGALIRSYAYDVSPSIYQYNAAGQATTNGGLVPGVNFGASVISGGSAIPYAQGYAELNYRSAEGWYGNLGMIYFGNNNTFNEPAFEIVRGTVRLPILGVRKTYVQFAVDNIFNVNPEIFDVYGAGISGPAVGGQTLETQLKGYGPRNFHLSLVHNL